MNCKKATQLLSESQDRDLSFNEKTALKMHLLMCSGCTNFSQQMQMIRQFAKGYSKDGSDMELDLSRSETPDKTD